MEMPATRPSSWPQYWSMVFWSAAISFWNVAWPADAQRPKSRLVLVLMAAGMAWMGSLVEPPCYTGTVRLSVQRESLLMRITYHHGVETAAGEAAVGAVEAGSRLELGLKVRLDLGLAVGEGRAIVEALDGSAG